MAHWYHYVVDGFAGLLISAGLFGVALFIVPIGSTNFALKNYPQSAWGAFVAVFIVVFVVEQMIGVAGGRLCQ